MKLPGVVAAVAVDGHIVYEGAAGVRCIGDDAAMTVDTVLGIFSMTKAITGAAAMQLVERGRLDLDTPAGEYIDYLGQVQVFDGFDASGAAVLRAPRTPVTLRNLLTHSSGFAYDMWNAELGKYVAATGMPNFGTLEKAALRMPLMFDPGSQWEYGIGIDWVGQLVEAVSGSTLGAYCSEHLFEPLGMASSGFAVGADMASRHASLHVRLPDGVVPFDMPVPHRPEFEMGGGGLHSTVRDYLAFTQMILDGGRANGQQILQPETLAAMSVDNLRGVSCRPLRTANPVLTLDVDFFPGMRQQWGLSFLINTELSPQGRPAGSLAWAGLANSYYWIDPVNRVTAVWATQLFPFFDPAAIDGFRRFETAVYDTL